MELFLFSATGPSKVTDVLNTQRVGDTVDKGLALTVEQELIALGLVHVSIPPGTNKTASGWAYLRPIEAIQARLRAGESIEAFLPQHEREYLWIRKILALIPGGRGQKTGNTTVAKKLGKPLFKVQDDIAVLKRLNWVKGSLVKSKDFPDNYEEVSLTERGSYYLENYQEGLEVIKASFNQPKIIPPEVQMVTESISARSKAVKSEYWLKRVPIWIAIVGTIAMVVGLLTFLRGCN